MGANRKMGHIDQDGANAPSEMMKSLNVKVGTFGTVPTLAPTSQTRKYPKLSWKRWGQLEKDGGKCG